MNILGLTFDQVIAELKPRSTDIPRLRREYLAAHRGGDAGEFTTDTLPISRRQMDGELIKFAQRMPDGYETESVIIPMRGRYRTWTSLCVSSQVGCAMGCTFCETAQLGLLKNLTADQIVGQAVAARREFGADVQNVVFMGMGEPLDNFEQVSQAILALNDPSGLAVRRSRISVSTVGRVAGIRKLGEMARNGFKRINLAVSLNAPNDEIRSQIMPINRAEPMADLMHALLTFPCRTGAYLMIEYVLIPGVNDRQEHAVELAAYLKPLRCCVNLIPYNPRRNSPWPAPVDADVQQFKSWVMDAGQPCMRRVTKGRDFMAACGQLGNPELRGLKQTLRKSGEVSLPIVDAAQA